MGTRQPTILICDDSLLVRKQMIDCLNGCGNFNILEAANGQASVDMYRQHLPDLVFLDIIMPDKTGIEALHEIKTINGRARVIIVSSLGTRTHLKNAMEAGASDFIQKPWENSQIDHIIKNLFT